LSNNQLASLPSGIGSLHSLKTLILSHNVITYLPQGLWTITSLSQLDLDYNQLDSLSAQVANLVNLGRLLLNNNLLTTLPLSLRQSAALDTALQFMQIDNNNICPSTLSALDASFPGWLDLRAESDWRTTQGTCP
jgi:Leucine-rich repeat (LRR) protein